ncbi:acyl-CoA thioesterase II, partial [Streptomyces lunaelactis]|nr:acyl-CoA thioesterase II [Streptomyces lunaelactis]
ARGRIYDRDGGLLVSVVQEGLFRPYTPTPAARD